MQSFCRWLQNVSGRHCCVPFHLQSKRYCLFLLFFTWSICRCIYLTMNCNFLKALGNYAIRLKLLAWPARYSPQPNRSHIDAYRPMSNCVHRHPCRLWYSLANRHRKLAVPLHKQAKIASILILSSRELKGTSFGKLTWDRLFRFGNAIHRLPFVKTKEMLVTPTLMNLR